MITNTEETYNGWANRATWNTHLWLTGDYEGMYHAAQRVANAGSIDAGAVALKRFCQLEWGSKTPDGDSLAKVDWVHVAEALRS